MKMKCAKVLIAGAAFAMATQANAASFFFDLTNTAGQAHAGALTGTFGNARNYAVTLPGATLHLQVTGWTVNNSAASPINLTSATSLASTVSSSFVGAFSGGLGVTNSNDNSGNNNQHTTDNFRGVDFFLLEFDAPVALAGIGQTAYVLANTAGATIAGSGDTDIQFATVNQTGGWNAIPGWNTQAFSTVSSTFSSSIQTSAGSTLANGTTTSRSINGGGTVSSLIGTRWVVFANGTDTNIDSFKVRSLTVNNYTLPVTPEPSTWMSMILGFGAMGGALRRRKSAVGKPSAA